MSKLGNDVVDLDDPAIASSHLNERFVRRVCHEAELERLAQSANPKVLLWSFFAAKEAAYKVVTKLGLEPGFEHRSFVVAPDLRSVRYGALTLELLMSVEGSCVHAVAWHGEGAPISEVALKAPEADASLAVRELLMRHVGGEGLEVVRDARPGSWDGQGPPSLWRNGKRLSVDVSLSHDGPYVAFALGVEPGVSHPLQTPVASGARLSRPL